MQGPRPSPCTGGRGEREARRQGLQYGAPFESHLEWDPKSQRKKQLSGRHQGGVEHSRLSSKANRHKSASPQTSRNASPKLPPHSQGQCITQQAAQRLFFEGRRGVGNYVTLLGCGQYLPVLCRTPPLSHNLACPVRQRPSRTKRQLILNTPEKGKQENLPPSREQSTAAHECSVVSSLSHCATQRARHNHDPPFLPHRLAPTQPPNTRSQAQALPQEKAFPSAQLTRDAGHFKPT